MATEHFIDSWRARLVAGLILIMSAASLVYSHREDITLFARGDDAPELPANPELAACLSERHGAVDQMRAEGVIDESKHTLFKQRATAICQDRFGG